MLVPLAVIKAYLNITDNTYDTFLTAQEEVISQAVELYCQRKFAATNYVETMYKDDYGFVNQVTLFHYPVNSIASVTLDGVTIDASEFRLQKPAGFLKRTCRFWFDCGKALVITYNAGYTTIPAVIQDTILNLVAERYNKKIAGVDIAFGSDVQSISIPGALSVTFDYSLTNNDANSTLGQILGNYRNSLNMYMSERAIIGAGKVEYVE